MVENMEGTLHPPRSILIIDDNEGDVVLMKEVLKESRFHSKISVAKDGLEAMGALHSCGEMQKGSLPDIIFLDLSLPKLDGYQVLREIRSDPALRPIPVIVFTGSNAPADIRKAYDCGANCYIVKPIGLDILEHTLRSVEEFWLGVAQLPNGRNAR
jgi:chemotaxis family two-component system response regulator Rcp1